MLGHDGGEHTAIGLPGVSMIRINAELLIPGEGAPVPDGVLLVDDQCEISYSKPRDIGAEFTPGARCRNVACGDIACTCRDLPRAAFMGARSRRSDPKAGAIKATALRAAQSGRDLTNALNAGITSVREVGGLGSTLHTPSSEGILDGPAIYAAGAVLSTTRRRTATCTAAPPELRGGLRPARRHPAARRRNSPSACGRCASSCAGVCPAD